MRSRCPRCRTGHRPRPCRRPPVLPWSLAQRPRPRVRGALCSRSRRWCRRVQRPSTRLRPGALPTAVPAVAAVWEGADLHVGPGAVGLRETRRHGDPLAGPAGGDGRPAAGDAVHQPGWTGRLGHLLRRLLHPGGAGGIRHRRLGPARRGVLDAGGLYGGRGAGPVLRARRIAGRPGRAADVAGGGAGLPGGPASNGPVGCCSTCRRWRRSRTWSARGLVGDDKINYFGSSYGTRIGAIYAELYPHRVGRMVLDGSVNISGTDTISQTEGFERALNNCALVRRRALSARGDQRCGAGPGGGLPRRGSTSDRCRWATGP